MSTPHLLDGETLMNTKTARTIICNSRFLFITTLAGILSCIADRAFAASAGMPLEGPIMQLVASLTGPVAKGFGIVAIVVTAPIASASAFSKGADDPHDVDIDGDDLRRGALSRCLTYQAGATFQ